MQQPLPHAAIHSSGQGSGQLALTVQVVRRQHGLKPGAIGGGRQRPPTGPQLAGAIPNQCRHDPARSYQHRCHLFAAVLEEAVNLRLRWDHPAAAASRFGGRALMGTSSRPCPKISRYTTPWLMSSRVMPPMAQSSFSDHPLKRVIKPAAITSANAPA
jgi:hypothetical protein